MAGEERDGVIFAVELVAAGMYFPNEVIGFSECSVTSREFFDLGVREIGADDAVLCENWNEP